MRLTRRRTLHLVAGALAILACTEPSLAKCRTSELLVRSPDLPGPLTISGEDTAGRFNIWNGPRVRMNNQAIHLDPAFSRGNFIAWIHGPVNQVPETALSFRVSFFCDVDGSSGPRKMYEVDYAFLPGSDGGFVYLPGKEDSQYSLNVSTIVHGVEGGVYRSTDEWEAVIRPILEKAITKQDR